MLLSFLMTTALSCMYGHELQPNVQQTGCLVSICAHNSWPCLLKRSCSQCSYGLGRHYKRSQQDTHNSSRNSQQSSLYCNTSHDLQIEWPLSIVISQQAMTQYQLIFRHLFELKYVERQLVGVWQLLQPTRGLFRYAHNTTEQITPFSTC